MTDFVRNIIELGKVVSMQESSQSPTILVNGVAGKKLSVIGIGL